MNSTMRIKRPLPPAPKPTRPIIVKEVHGISHHLEVRPEKPPVIVESRKKPKRRTPSEAIAESARKKAEAKRQRKAEAIRLWESGMTVQEIVETVKAACIFGEVTKEEYLELGVPEEQVDYVRSLTSKDAFLALIAGKKGAPNAEFKALAPLFINEEGSSALTARAAHIYEEEHSDCFI